MKTTRARFGRSLARLALAVVVASGLVPVGSAYAAALVVTTTADSGDGSLRQAIVDANAIPGKDTISFNIAGTGVQTITPPSALPVISEALEIDGTTQPGYADRPLVELSGVNAPTGVSGLKLATTDSTIRGLVINRFPGHGLVIEGGGGHTIRGSYIGTNAAGDAAAGNGWSGILIRDTVDNTIGGASPDAHNVISGNHQRGILIMGSGATGNRIQGNFIGPSAAGDADRGNLWAGIRIESPGNLVGGTGAGEGNVVSGNNAYGVRLSGPNAVGNRIEGNRIGTKATENTGLGNSQPGVLIDGNASGNIVGGSDQRAANSIGFNGDAGVMVSAGAGNTILGNAIFNNRGLGIDLGGDGFTPNDPGDLDGGPNNLQNAPVLTAVIPGIDQTVVQGRLSSTISSGAPLQYRVELFRVPVCDPAGAGEGQFFLDAATVEGTTDAQGNLLFTATIPAVLEDGQVVAATATDAAGNTSEFSRCAAVSAANDSWPAAMRLNPVAPSALDPSIRQASISQSIFNQDQARWFKFSVTPGSKVIVKLNNLAANYDLVLYRDIAAEYATITTTQDLVQLQAEFAADAFSPEAYSRDAFSPWIESPWIESPWIESPDVYSANAFSPWIESPDAFSPWIESPWIESPWIESPDPRAFSSAQLRSLIAVSAAEGTAAEQIAANTWENGGDFYVRVRGRNGAFNPTQPFRLEVTALSGACGSLESFAELPTTEATRGDYKTLILTDPARLAGSGADKAALSARLARFAARPEVRGAVVDLGLSERITRLNAQAEADAYRGCPTAKNYVANEIKAVVDSFFVANSALQYVVIVGADDVIPFFRHPDQSLLAPESNYVVPVQDHTASEASLRLGYVLSQDQYGATRSISLNANAFPLPDLAVGRLVETPAEIGGMLDAYLSTAAGVVPAPAAALVTGYDFLTDGAQAVQGELERGMGRAADTLISDGALPQTGPACATLSGGVEPCLWTADNLKTRLLGRRHDLVYLAGHFSQGGALAADHQTRLTAAEVAQSAVDLSNALVFSAGCHSGYSTVDAHLVAGVTSEPDWAQAFARKRATFIGGTGYQYGDTDFVEYSERLYQAFAGQLRNGTGPVSVGQALVAAKREYLAGTVQMLGIHEKALLQATLFGLPMLSVDMPQGRGTRPVPPPDIDPPAVYTTNPGRELGLLRTEYTLAPSLAPPVTVDGGSYLVGGDGVLANPLKPILPLELSNVSIADTVLRGVGFRGGAYADLPSWTPRTGAPATEEDRRQSPFISDVFYPARPWRVNYFDALANPAGGVTRLAVTPAQYRSSGPLSSSGTLRAFSSMTFWLYYSDNIATYASGDTPGQAAPPAISGVSAAADGGVVTFKVNAVGDPSAGMQEVWVTYTATDGDLAGVWQSLDLVQSRQDSTLWQATLSGVSAPEKLRFMVQAANGVGLVAMATNLGSYYTPTTMAAAPQPPVPQPATLGLVSAPASAAYGTRLALSAELKSRGRLLAGQPISFQLGGQRVDAITGVDGRATVSIPVHGRPGDGELVVAFAGTEEYAPTVISRPFTIAKQATQLVLTPPAGGADASDAGNVVATLTGAGAGALGQKTVFFVVSGAGETHGTAVITDGAGRAPLGPLPLPAGSYTVSAHFGGVLALPGGASVTLSDDLYAAASDSLEAEIATAVYSGATNIPAGAPLKLAAAITRDGDSGPGDPTMARVHYEVRDTVGSLVAQTTATELPSGTSPATVTGLAPGVYTIRTTLTGGFFARAEPQTALLTVYDPSPGLVTGGGWIDSPAGAFAGDPVLAGKATFGFVARRASGAAVPRGSTQFQAGDLRFHADGYEWLVVAGARAQLKGSGTLGGRDGYGFMLTVDDAAVDKFRMKIWDTNNGNAVVYDSQPGAPDEQAATTALGGGSIVIHR